MNENRYRYQLQYRKEHYKHFNLLLNPRNPLDAKILEGLKSIPSGNKTEFMKQALAEKLGIHE